MEIVRLVGKPLHNNMYVCISGSDAVLVDASDSSVIVPFLHERCLQLRAILLTHAHPDHIYSLRLLLDMYSVPVYCHSGETLFLELGGFSSRDVTFVSHNDVLSFFGKSFSIIHTPGHTPGGVCYLVNDVLFSGDTLFKDARGRTDLLGGNEEKLLHCIRERLLSLPDTTRVLPGHYDETTIGAEKKYYLL